MKVCKTVLFWALSFTWGGIMTLFGLFVAFTLIAAGRKPKRFHMFVFFETGENWGGFECGAFFVVNRGASEALKRHEAGHGVQNLIFGPLTPVLVSVPSAIRYWVRRGKAKRGRSLPPYDEIWFERQATRLGKRYFSARPQIVPFPDKGTNR